ncbi:MAG: glycosyltransferase family 39 protein, partial [Planctomycetales bacterium]|nr:glycosyltransferase family 39 protein [Planctomycetales bacterium]
MHRVIEETEAALNNQVADYEILVVDSNGRQVAAEAVQELSVSNPRVRLAGTSPSRDNDRALWETAALGATKSWVAMLDGNGQFDPRELDRMLLLSKDYDIVCGYRVDSRQSLVMRVGSRAYNFVASILLGTNVRDTNCLFKLVRRDCVRELPLATTGAVTHAEVISRARLAGASVVEVGVSERNREANRTRSKLSDWISEIASFIRFWWTFALFPADARVGKQSPSNTADMDWAPAQRRMMTALLAGMAAVMLFTNLNYELFEPDETRYAQISLEMYESGDWIVPTFRGEPFFDKPPLLYWLTTAAYSTFGVHEWTARLPSACAAFLTVMLLFVWGRRLLGDTAAWCGAAVLLLSAGFPVAGRFVVLDALLTCCVAATFLATANACIHHRRSWLWFAVAGVTLALGVLTKGPLAMVLCLPPLIAYGWLYQRRDLIDLRVAALMVVPTLVMALPWFIAITGGEDEFAGHFFWKHNLVRFFNAFDHQEPWWFYLPVLLLGMFPCSLLFPGLGSYLFSRSAEQRQRRGAELGFFCLAVAWIVGFFSMSTCKLPTYILPALPPLSLILGKAFADTVLSTQAASWAKRFAERLANPLATFFVISAVAAIGANQVIGNRGAGAIVLAALVIAAAVALAWSPLRAAGRPTGQRWLALASLSLVLGVYLFDFVVPNFAAWRGSAGHVANLRASLGEPDSVPVVYLNRSMKASGFYIQGGEVVELRGANPREI